MLLRAGLLISMLALLTPVYAADQIGWEDLEPAMPEGIEDPFVDLTDDQLFALSMVARYRELIPTPDTVLLEGIGHYPQVEAPERVLEHYFDFRARLAAVEGGS